MGNLSRRRFIQYGSVAVGTGLLAVTSNKVSMAAVSDSGVVDTETKTIKIGVMYSTMGDAAVIEKPLQAATLLAMEHINTGTGLWSSQGAGIGGRKIEPIILDPGSNWDLYNQAPKQLLDEENVVGLMGWDVCSNLQIEKRLTSLSKGNRVRGFFIGTDYTYARAAHASGKATLERLGGSVVGDEYVALNTSDFSNIIEKVNATQPDLIISGLVGDDASTFQHQLFPAGIETDYSSSVAYLEGRLPENRTVARQLKSLSGNEQFTHHMVEATYAQTIAMAQSMKEMLVDFRRELTSLDFSFISAA